MYVSKEQLAGFSKYKYSCIDTSPISLYILQPFWTKVVEHVPLWLAPNVLTLAGFLLLVIQYAVLWVFDPQYESAELNRMPSWVWWFSAFCHFTAHTLDGIDGKQARRTGTSSPLGELFDHGLDSWSSSFITLNLVCLFRAESFSFVPGGYVGMLCLSQFAIITPHWEKYNTGVMFLPWSLDFSLLVITLCYMVTAVCGTLFWEEVRIFGISLVSYIWITAVSSIFLVGLPFSIYTIISANRNETGRNLPFIEGVLPLVAPFILSVLMFAINYFVSDHIRILTYIMGVVFSNIMCRLIICQMTQTRCNTFNKLFYVLFVCLASLIFINDETMKWSILVATSVVTTLAHIHYGGVVVRTLAKLFEIKIFSIKSETEV